MTPAEVLQELMDLLEDIGGDEGMTPEGIQYWTELDDGTIEAALALGVESGRLERHDDRYRLTDDG
jgi:hypothetical protein